MSLDAITTEVIGHYLLAVAEEMGVALVKSAYSVNVKERYDCSSAILTANGETVAQAAYQPIHLGSMLYLVTDILKRFPYTDIRPGDMFISNDPYGGGGQHLPDLAVASPLFEGDRLIAWAANIIHHSDVGGRVYGSMALDNTSIYQEGLRVPTVRIFDRGHLNEAVLEVIVQNSRLPEERTGDLRAQFSANTLALQKLEELKLRYGADALTEGMDALLSASERAFRIGLEALPSGTSSWIELVDDDGIGDTPVKIQVSVTLQGGQVILDFEGSDVQTRGARNLVLSGLHSICYYVMKAIVDPDLSTNGGYYRAITIKAPPGTVVNPLPPAATAYRMETAQRVVDAILGALVELMPERVQAASMGSGSFSLSGVDPLTAQPYSDYESMGGGGGAGCDYDGLDCVQVHGRNSGNVPIEVCELEFPLLIDRYEIIPDSGGAGRQRGGLGMRRDIRVMRGNVVVNAMSDRHRTAASGLLGGKPGASGEFVLYRQGVEIKFTGHISELWLSAGDVFSVRTSGGGGFGDPHERDSRLVDADFADGLISSRLPYRSTDS